ncbi:MAG: SPFH domain-containing protein [Candidatus Nanopelagicales bacterium]
MAFFKDSVSELFIAVPDEAKLQLVYKWPNNTIKKLSAAIVDADEAALFVSRGEIAGKFGPGRYKLDAKEWPFLGTLVDWATDDNAYRAELFFVSTKQFPNEKFGSKLDNVIDPRTNIVVTLRMFGEYAIRVTDVEKLVLELTGTGQSDNNDQIMNWVDQMIIKSLRHFVTTQITNGSWPVLGLATYLPEIETAGVTAVNAEIEQYGLKVQKFGNVEISLSDEDAAQLKELSKDTAYSQLAGSFGAYAAGSALIGAGEGMAKGEGGNPTLMAAGMGIGGGMGGATNASPSRELPPPGQPLEGATPPSSPPPADGGGAAAAVPAPVAAQPCVKCSAAITPGAKFCPECGTPQTATCTECGATLTGGAKFCSECGKPQAPAADTP